MSFNRVNLTGWLYNNTLTSDQANALDLNITNGIDKRTGQTDTILSELTVDGTGSITFGADAGFTIEDPTTIAIGDGTLAVDCTLVGETEPLKFGYASVSVTSTNYTVLEAAFTKYVIRLTGALSGNTTVILPTVSGYTKLIDNRCTSTEGYKLRVRTVAGDGVYINLGKAALVYCDGVDILPGIARSTNIINSIWSKNEASSGYGDEFQELASLTAVQVGDYAKTFYNVKEKDIFEITYTIGLASDAAGGYVSAMLDNTEDPASMNESIIRVAGNAQITSTMSTTYVIQDDQTSFTINLIASSDGTYNGFVLTPVNLTIKHITP